MPKFTPGPWTLSDKVWTERCVDFHEISGSNVAIWLARVQTCREPKNDFDYSVPPWGRSEEFRAERLANAKLIAAAPDLYEALDTVRNCCVHAFDAQGPTVSIRIDRRLIEMVRDALAKAGGGE